MTMIRTTVLSLTLLALPSVGMIEKTSAAELTAHQREYTDGSGLRAEFVKLQSGEITSISDAIALLNNPRSNPRVAFIHDGVVDFTDDEGAPYGFFPRQFRFEDIPILSGDPNNFAARFTGFIRIPAGPPPNTYTFAVGSDDGFRLTINDGTRDYVAEYAGLRAIGVGPLLQITFPPQGGLFPIELVYFESGGGAILEFSFARGAQNIFSTSTFTLVSPSMLSIGVPITSPHNVYYLYYPVIESNSSTWSEISISNPTPTEAQLEISLYESTGNRLETRSLKLGANQQTGFRVDTFFGITGEFSGWVEVKSDVSLIGFETWGSRGSNSLAGVQAASLASQNLYLPHIAIGSGWETLVSVINVSENPGNVVLTAYDEDGIEIKSITKALSSKQQLKANVRDLFMLGEQLGGHIEIASDVPVVAAEVFGSGSGQTGVLASATSSPFFRTGELDYILNFPLVVADSERWTVIAIANSSNLPVVAVINLRDKSGQVVASKRTILKGKEQTAFLAEELIGTSLSSPLEGWIQVISDAPLSGLEIVGLKGQDVFSGIQAATFPARNVYLAHIAEGSGWQSIVSIINYSGVQVKVTLTAYKPDGTQIGEITKEIAPFGQLIGRIGQFFNIGTQLGGQIKISATNPVIISEFFDDGRGQVGVLGTNDTIDETNNLVAYNVVSKLIRASEGGSISIAKDQNFYLGGLELIIPPGALKQDTIISIEYIISTLPFIDKNLGLVSLPLNFKPDGLQFTKPALLKIPYSQEILDQLGIKSLENFSVSSFDPRSKLWERIPIKQINTLNSLILVEINHFSSHGTFDFILPEGITTEELFKMLEEIVDLGRDFDAAREFLNSSDGADFLKTLKLIFVSGQIAEKWTQKDYEGLSLLIARELGELGIGGLCKIYTVPLAAAGGGTVGAIAAALTCSKAAESVMDVVEAFGRWLGDRTFWLVRLVQRPDMQKFQRQLEWYIFYKALGIPDSALPLCGKGWLRDPAKQQCDFSDNHCVPFVSDFPCSPGFPYTFESVRNFGNALLRIGPAFDPSLIRSLKEDYGIRFSQAISEFVRSRQTKPVFILSDQIGKAPLTVTVDASQSQPGAGRKIVTYRWNFGDKTLAEGIRASHKYSNPGKYTITLSVQDDLGKVFSTSQDVTVEPAQSAQLPISETVDPKVSASATSVKQGSSLTISGSRFTPNSTATLHIRRPSGAEEFQGKVNTTSNGTFSFTYRITESGPLGDYTYWAIDDATKKQSNTGTFTVTPLQLAPQIDFIDPSQITISSFTAPNNAGTFNITINGSNFMPGVIAIVEYAETAIYGDGLTHRQGEEAARITQVNFVSSSRIVVTLTLSSGKYLIKVRNPDGQTSNPKGLSVFAPSVPPQINDVQPRSVKPGVFDLTITGSNFDSGAVDEVYYAPDGRFVTSGQVLERSSTRIVVRENITQVGTYFIKIKNSNGLRSNPSPTFKVAVANEPPVARFTMTSGSQSATENQTLNLTVEPGKTATVNFSAARSFDPDGQIAAYKWQINGQQVSTSRDFNFSLGKGTHQVLLTVTDNQGAEGSAGASIIITETSAAPTLQIDGGTFSSRRQLETFTFTGSNYTPNRTVTRYLRDPSNNVSVLSPTLSADSNGNISWTYTPPCTAPTGTYKVWVRDDATGRTSNEVTEEITPNPSCSSPTLQIDGGTFSSRRQLETFTFTGSNYTPNRTVTRYLRDPSNNVSVLSPTLSADSNGNISWTYTPPCTAPTGTYKVWVRDDATGRTSNEVTEEITPNPSCSSPTLRIDGGTFSSRRQLETFTFTGSNYTPNRTVTRYLRDPSNNVSVLSPTLSADSNGNISWTYTPPCTAPTGTYKVWVRDDATGRTSNEVTEEITPNPSCSSPTLRIDGGTFSSRRQLETFTFTGSNYTPNRTVTRYLRDPSNNVSVLSPTLSADSNGNISWTYTPPCTAPTGTYKVWVRDDATGRTSNEVTEEITPNPSCSSPTLRIDGGTFSSRRQLETFTFTGSNYTPNRTVTRYLRDPSNNVSVLSPTLSADSNGNISWTYTPPCTAPTGTYKVWVRDDATGRTSNEVTEEITPNPSCSSPTLRIDGGTFSSRRQLETFTFTGSNYTPNRTVTRYLRDPSNNVSVLSPTLSADSNGNISWTYTPPCTAPTGTYKVWVRDDATGRTSNEVTEEITPNPSCSSPTLRIDGGTFSSRRQLETFTFTGSNYTPNRTVTRYLRDPSNNVSVLSPTLSADSNGNISWTYTPPCTAPTGTYKVWVRDDATGRTSNEVTEEITPNPSCSSPTLRIDGGTFSSRRQLETFTFTGSNYTPNRTVTRYLRDPSNNVSVLSPTLSADSNGNISWTYTPPCTAPTGTYKVWVRDDATGRTSNEVTEEITRNPSCGN
jgi:hypothetical protein